MMESVFDDKGKRLELGQELGRGGEATVFRLVHDRHRALKLYHKPDAERAQKLRVMLENPPHDPTREAGHISIAWPEALVHDREGRVIGFIMPLLDMNRSLALHQIYNPKIRRQRAPGLNWRYLLRIARNLCTVVSALHERGYIIGDLNESNIVVTDRALVSLVDCDSIQVKEGRKVYRCKVAKAEYTAPELHNKDFDKVIRNENHDNFALSILLFLLLMEGVHPFAGIFKGEGDPPGLVDNIAAGHSPYLQTILKPALLAPPFGHLPASLRRLFRKAFVRQVWFPRPSAKTFKAELERLEQNLRMCTQNGQHVHFKTLKVCPWCERVEKLGLESYPALAIPYQEIIQVEPNPKLLNKGFWPWIKRLPFTGLSFVLLTGTFGYGLLLGLPKWFDLGSLEASGLALLSFMLLSFGGLGLGFYFTRKKAEFVFYLYRLERVVVAIYSATLLVFTVHFVISKLKPVQLTFLTWVLGLASLWLFLFYLVWYLQKRLQAD